MVPEGIIPNTIKKNENTTNSNPSVIDADMFELNAGIALMK